MRGDALGAGELGGLAGEGGAVEARGEEGDGGGAEEKMGGGEREGELGHGFLRRGWGMGEL